MQCFTGLYMMAQHNPERARAMAEKRAAQGDRSWLDALSRMSAVQRPGRSGNRQQAAPVAQDKTRGREADE